MDIYSSIFNKNGLSLERLQSFCLVAKAKGFNRAAGDNAYKQSQFSRQVADLEKFLDVRLFVRKGKSIELTTQGRELYAICKDFFYGLSCLKSETDKHKEDLIISAGQSVIDFLIPKAFDKEISEKLGKVSFIANGSEAATQDIMDYRAHCAFVSKPNKNKDLGSQLILSSPLVMIFAKKDAGKLYSGSELAGLAKNPIAAMEGHGEFFQSVKRLFGKHRPNIQFEAPTFQAIKRIAATGKAMAFVPDYIVTEEDKIIFNLHPLPGGSKLSRDIYLIYRKNLANQNKRMLEIIRQLAENITLN